MEGTITATVIQGAGDRSGAELIVEDDRADILASIRAPSIELALWSRAIPTCVEYWLQSLSPAEMPCGRILAPRNDFRSALDEVFEASKTPPGQSAGLLAADIVEIATLFVDIAETDLVDIGLGVIQHDSCWKFHRDHVRLRLLTTYFGPGTQYVSGTDADRALREQKAFDGEIHEIPRLTVAMFKGAKDASGKGIVHRSPPIAGTGQTRLVLTLNAPSEVSPESWRNDAAARMRESAGAR